MELEKILEIGSLTRFYIANGIHSARVIADKLIQRHGYSEYIEEQQNPLYVNVKYIMICLADAKFGVLIKHKNDYLFYPTVKPHELAAGEMDKVKITRAF